MGPSYLLDAAVNLMRAFLEREMTRVFRVGIR